ncbi:MAG: TIGR01777 family oxidoreductase [Mangrovimonas sp.]|nr:TIGR01777 family oxidoreductase [Mangrovimonas sp.]
MKTIIIAGGSGFLGSALETHLTALGFQVNILTRSPKRPNEIKWDGQSLGHWVQQLENAEAVINLTGKSINSRMTEENKKLIVSSRVDSTLCLGEAINACEKPPKTWINASGAAIYPSTLDTPMDEFSPETEQGFLEDVVRAWEKAFYTFSNPNTRKILLRINVVLGNDGGALPTLKQLTHYGLGGKQGSGKQLMSWIHLEDLVRIIEFLLANESLEGVFNICAPQPVTNKKFMATMRNMLHMPFGIPQPEFLLKLGSRLAGIDADLILKSRNVVPKRLLDNGFQFKYPEIEQALKNLFN